MNDFSKNNTMTYCGMIAIVGCPNVGKSTLLNQLLGKKISITSRKPQTTRYRLLGIKTIQHHQLIYIDTPGFHAASHQPMDRYLNRTARGALQIAQVIIFVIDKINFNTPDAWILEQLHHIEVPIILAINKIDRLENHTLLLPFIEKISQQFAFYKIIPLSAKTGEQVEALENEIIQALPAGPFQFPKEQVTDQNDSFMAAEIIREKLMRQLGQEIPYALTVTILAFSRETKLVRISAVIWVEKSSQKGIVIGQAGERLKKIGRQARLDMEKLFAQKVFLQLWVKVKTHWRDSLSSLKELGYEEE